MMPTRSKIEGSLLSLEISNDLSFSLTLSPWIVILIPTAIALLWLVRYVWLLRHAAWSEIEFSACGVRSKFRPDYAEKQIAYEIWVELSTRKIGLPIDLENDVIIEIYDSWYSFFSIFRELIRKIPVRKLNDKGAKFIVDVSLKILNQQLRMHLTKWQARYRKWHEAQSLTDSRDPQDVQKDFPQYKHLTDNMLLANKSLIECRKEMYRLATGSSEPNFFEKGDEHQKK